MSFKKKFWKKKFNILHRGLNKKFSRKKYKIYIRGYVKKNSGKNFSSGTLWDLTFTMRLPIL